MTNQHSCITRMSSQSETDILDGSILMGLNMSKSRDLLLNPLYPGNYLFIVFVGLWTIHVMPNCYTFSLLVPRLKVKETPVMFPSPRELLSWKRRIHPTTGRGSALVSISHLSCLTRTCHQTHQSGRAPCQCQSSREEHLLTLPDLGLFRDHLLSKEAPVTTPRELLLFPAPQVIST